VLLLYDITDRNSYVNVVRWLTDLNQFIAETTVVVLIGNKVPRRPPFLSLTTQQSDLEEKRQISPAEAEAFAIKNKLFWLEASALDDRNVAQSFQHVFEGCSLSPLCLSVSLPLSLFVSLCLSASVSLCVSLSLSRISLHLSSSPEMHFLHRKTSARLHSVSLTDVNLNAPTGDGVLIPVPQEHKKKTFLSWCGF
jgi:hypothetical protein